MKSTKIVLSMLAIGILAISFALRYNNMAKPTDKIQARVVNKSKFTISEAASERTNFKANVMKDINEPQNEKDFNNPIVLITDIEDDLNNNELSEQYNLILSIKSSEGIIITCNLKYNNFNMLPLISYSLNNKAANHKGEHIFIGHIFL
ncbi:hypothetical protein OXPF_08970 [Oxobacter pfennigii]|uniref:Uncharacterized protein n=1 Tax=Oxobacter pfennigii TaxID=36849 RepID=A0A0N8NTS7_9CLOT|nr:hypothetical protein [Oxobacter pfennigii]KPU45664.1 hypothetical protein OXPF_08970 [Oxobacter pfennigii]